MSIQHWIIVNTCYALVTAGWTWTSLPVYQGLTTFQGINDSTDNILSKHGELLFIFDGVKTWRYHLNSGEYIDLNTTMDCGACRGMVSGSTGDAIYAGMGLTRDDHIKTYTNRMWIFTFSSQKWENLKTSTLHEPEPRTGAAASFYSLDSKKLYVAMGYGIDGYLNDIYSLDIVTLVWTREIEHTSIFLHNVPRPRYMHSIVMVSQYKLVLFGGCQSVPGAGGVCPSSDLWTFDLLLKRWRHYSQCLLPRNHGSMVRVLPWDNRLLLYGGVFNSTAHTPSVPDDLITEISFGGKDVEYKRMQSIGDIPLMRYGSSLLSDEHGLYMAGGISRCCDNGSSNGIYRLQNTLSTNVTYPCMDTYRRFLTLRMLHGLLMLIAVGVAMPVGVAFSRYRLTQNWKSVHLRIQAFGYVCMFAGIVTIAWTVQEFHLTSIHSYVGVAVAVLTTIQPLSILLRKSILHYNDERHGRKYNCWRIMHAICGWGALLLGAFNITTGLFMLLPAPAWWAWFAWLGAWLIAYVGLSCATKRVNKDDEDRINDLSILDRYGSQRTPRQVDTTSDKLPMEHTL